MILYFCFQAYYFDRDDKSLPNFVKFFHAQSKEEREHAEKLMSLQNKRGGRIFLQDIRVCTDTSSTQFTVCKRCPFSWIMLPISVFYVDSQSTGKWGAESTN